jgi:cell division protein FtsL
MKDFPKYAKRSSKSLFRKKTTVAKRSSLKFAFTWILMIGVALFFVQQRISYIRLEKQVQALLKEKEDLQLSILPLKLEERFLTQHDKIEKRAQKELGLQVPRQVQIIKAKVPERLIKVNE